MNSIEDILQQWLYDVEDDLKVAYDDEIKFGFGNWKKTLDVPRVTNNSGDFVGVINAADYSYYMEYGRGKGKKPPKNVIRAWMDEKGIIPKSINGGAIPTRDQLAFLIQRKIGEEGTKAPRGHNIMEKVITDERLQELYDEINKVALLEISVAMEQITKGL